MMTTVIHFAGNCNEAISFYKETLGAEIKSINYFKDAPENHGMEQLPADFVMHSEILILGQMIHMSDGAKGNFSGDNFSFMITKDTTDEVSKAFHQLSEGGKIIEELAPTFWASMYGMVVDRFGICWQVMTAE